MKKAVQNGGEGERDHAPFSSQGGATFFLFGGVAFVKDNFFATFFLVVGLLVVTGSFASVAVALLLVSDNFTVNR